MIGLSIHKPTQETYKAIHQNCIILLKNWIGRVKFILLFFVLCCEYLRHYWLRHCLSPWTKFAPPPPTPTRGAPRNKILMFGPKKKLPLSTGTFSMSLTIPSSWGAFTSSAISTLSPPSFSRSTSTSLFTQPLPSQSKEDLCRVQQWSQVFYPCLRHRPRHRIIRRDSRFW